VSEDTAVSAALKALGLNTPEFKALSPEAKLAAIADKLAGTCIRKGCGKPRRSPAQRMCRRCHADAMKATRARRRARWQELENLRSSTSSVSRETAPVTS
jgi:DNA polymerase III psi subunit